MVQTSENEPVFYRMQWNVDRGRRGGATRRIDIISLQNNDIFEGTVISDNHGQHFVIDLTKLEYDDDIYIGTRKLDNPDDKITFDVSLTVRTGSWCHA